MKTGAGVDLRGEFEKRGPWVTRFWVDGEALGGSQYDPTGDMRIAMFKSASGPLAGKRLLELGPLEGGHTLQLAREGASVLAIEGREANFRRCLFIKDLFALDNAEVILGDLRDVDLNTLGRFDSIFNVGVLYHLNKPWTLLTSLGKVSSRMFLSTHCAPSEKANVTIEVDGHRLRGMRWREGSVKDPLSGLQKHSFWPTRESLDEMLILTGWKQVRWLDYTPDHVNGPIASLWAERPLD